MFEAIIGVGGTVLGTLLGFWLSESSQNNRQAKEEKNQIQITRVMIELEINQNLAHLNKLLSDMELDKTNGDQNSLNAQKLLQTPFPIWNHSFFQSQLAIIPKALTTEELRRVYSHHNSIDNLSEIRFLLSELQDKQNDSIASSNSGHTGIYRTLFMPRLTFSQNAGEIWTKFYQIANALLQEGNPLNIKHS